MYQNPPFIDVHTHQITNDSSLKILNVFAGEEIPLNCPDNVFFSSGIHPWYLEDWEKQLMNLRLTIYNQRVIAVGECGLDKNMETALDIQVRIFEEHVHISETVRKPLIVHCVKAYDELIRIKKQMKPVMPWIIHGFNKSPGLGFQCIEHGIFLSFGKALFGNTNTLFLVKTIPPDRFFLETENSDFLISDTYEKCAEIRNSSPEDLKRDIFNNFCNLFKWG